MAAGFLAGWPVRGPGARRLGGAGRGGHGVSSGVPGPGGVAPISRRYVSSSEGRVTARPGISPSGLLIRAASAATSRVGAGVRSRLRHALLQPGHGGRPGVPPGQGRGRAGRDDPPGREHRHPVGQGLRLVQVVGAEQDRGAARGQLPDQVPELPPRRGVEPRGRLVQDQQLGAADQAEREVHPAALTAGQPAQPGARLRGQAHRPDQLARFPGSRVVAGQVPDHLAHGQLAEVAGVLGHDADPGPPAAARGRRVSAQHGHLARVPPPAGGQDLHGSGLARPVGPEQGDDLSGADVQVQSV